MVTTDEPNGSDSPALRRSPVLTRRVSPDEILVRAPGAETVALAGTSLALWETIEDGLTVGQLIEHLADRYGVDASELEEPVRTTIAQLVAVRAICSEE